MADFINTIDVHGDEAVVDSLIDKSIAEFKDKAVTKVGDYAFCNCLSLTEVKMPNATSIGNQAFNNCTALTAVDFPNVTGLSGSCFAKCTSLTSVSLPAVEHMGNGSIFANCSALTSVSFPSAKYLAGTRSFQNCVNLVSVDLPLLGGTHTETFYGCSGLEFLRLPSCTAIGQSTFKLSALKALVLDSEKICSLANVNSFEKTPIASGTGYIYVPKALLSQYASATNWSTYANQFRALEDYTVDGTTTGDLDETKI